MRRRLIGENTSPRGAAKETAPCETLHIDPVLPAQQGEEIRPHAREPYDLEPVVANNPRDALNHLKKRPFDMIIAEAHLGYRLLEVWHYPALFRDVVRLHNDDEGIEKRNEAVVVTYFSNLLTRKMGYSLVPYDNDLLSRRELECALNMGANIRKNFESSLSETIENIKSSCFIVD